MIWVTGEKVDGLMLGATVRCTSAYVTVIKQGEANGKTNWCWRVW